MTTLIPLQKAGAVSTMAALLKIEPTPDNYDLTDYIRVVAEEYRNRGIPWGMPFNWSRVLCVQSRHALIAELTVNKKLSKAFIEDIGRFEPRTPLLIFDDHLRGPDSPFFLFAAPADQQAMFRGWLVQVLNNMTSLNVIITEKSGLLVAAFPVKHTLKT